MPTVWRGEGRLRDTVTRTLAHESFGWRLPSLLVRIRRSAVRRLPSCLALGQ